MAARAPVLGLIFYDSFVKILVLEHAVAQQIHFTSFLLDGGPVRFPDLKIAFLEAGVGWVPYLMERLDEKYEKLPHQAPLLDQGAERVRQGRRDLFFLRAGREDSSLRHRPGAGKKDHVSVGLSRTSGRLWNSSSRTFRTFRRAKICQTTVKKLILRDNCIDFYSLKL